MHCLGLRPCGGLSSVRRHLGYRRRCQRHCLGRRPCRGLSAGRRWFRMWWRCVHFHWSYLLLCGRERHLTRGGLVQMTTDGSSEWPELELPPYCPAVRSITESVDSSTPLPAVDLPRLEWAD